MKYQTIDISTIDGTKKAERLKAKGYEFQVVGIDKLQFSIPTNTQKDRDRADAIARLRELVKPGDRIYTVLRHVSRSGMYRAIDLYVIRDGERIRISYTASILLEGYDNKHESCRASGCGMDMGFHLVYSLAYALYGNGWECTGDHCPHNDHVNDRTSPRGKGVIHKGGYALRQEWL